MGRVSLTKEGIGTITAPFRWLLILTVSFFFAAGQMNILRVWIYVGVYFLGALFSGYIFINKIPGLANERGKIKRGTKRWDTPIIMAYFFLAILVTPIIAGLDHRHAISLLSFYYLYFGIALYFISLLFAIWPLLHNPFFEGTVRIQKDRNQYVIQTGPYRYIRHPGYVGMIVGSLALPFAFGSLISFIPSGIMIVLVVLRTYLEDQILQKELPGYKLYTRKVRYRLIPYIW